MNVGLGQRPMLLIAPYFFHALYRSQILHEEVCCIPKDAYPIVGDAVYSLFELVIGETTF